MVQRTVQLKRKDAEKDRGDSENKNPKPASTSQVWSFGLAEFMKKMHDPPGLLLEL